MKVDDNWDLLLIRIIRGIITNANKRAPTKDIPIVISNRRAAICMEVRTLRVRSTVVLIRDLWCQEVYSTFRIRGLQLGKMKR